MKIHIEPKWRPVTIVLENREEFMGVYYTIKGERGLNCWVDEFIERMRLAKISMEK